MVRHLSARTSRKFSKPARNQKRKREEGHEQTPFRNVCVACAGRCIGAAGAVSPGLPPATTCHAGMDTNGAFFLIAVPANYNHRLLLWNHGYSLAPPGKLGAERSEERRVGE